MTNLLEIIYLVTSLLLIIGIKKMSSPKTATMGFIYSGIGMSVAIAATVIVVFSHQMDNILLLLIMLTLGTILAWVSGAKVQMIAMPQMIALYNGMGGGAAAIIAALELLHTNQDLFLVRCLALAGGMIGSISFSGSLVAYLKLRDQLKKIIILPMHNLLNIFILIIGLGIGGLLLFYSTHYLLISYFGLFLVLGITATIATGGANMPVVISLFNAMTGLAVAFNGFALNNTALVIAGTLVGASGSLLTQLMAKAMNKQVTTILFPHSAIQQAQSGSEQIELKQMDIYDAATLLNYANKVIIVPGYGMAVAQAQFKIKELTNLLEAKGVPVKFAIHPVAGRMPGHMNVLLAEADISYDKIFDLDEINPEFATAEVALVIGANDVINPDAQTVANSPIYGMPILEAYAAKNVLVIKRGAGKGFSGVENSLFSMNNVYMVYGDAQDVLNKLVQSIKENS